MPIAGYDTELLQAKSLDDIDAWIEGGGDKSQMHRVVAARANWANLPVMIAWLHRDEERRQQGQDKLTERATKAAEESSRHARTSAGLAAIAIVISLFALGASVWPLFR